MRTDHVQGTAFHIERATSEHPGFIALVHHLDAYLAGIDGEEHAFYARYNGIAALSNVVVAMVDGRPVGCGAFKPFDDRTVEIKRMYVLPEQRRTGVAGAVLEALETWVHSLGFNRCVLETGRRMPEAIAFYTRNGYSVTANFGPYEGVANSVCFEKRLRAS